MRQGNLSLTRNVGISADHPSSLLLTSPHDTSLCCPRPARPLVCDLQQRDTNSLLRVEKGGEFQVWGKTWFTKSTITFMRPCTKDRSWIRNNRRRNEVRWTWGQWNRHHQQQQQRSGAQPAGATTALKPQPPFCSPFGPKVSAGYTFWERFDISPSYLKVSKGCWSLL